jgi:hypothetical protein
MISYMVKSANYDGRNYITSTSSCYWNYQIRWTRHVTLFREDEKCIHISVIKLQGKETHTLRVL